MSLTISIRDDFSEMLGLSAEERDQRAREALAWRKHAPVARISLSDFFQAKVEAPRLPKRTHLGSLGHDL
jgi:hypothetical protein